MIVYENKTVCGVNVERVEIYETCCNFIEKTYDGKNNNTLKSGGPQFLQHDLF